ncbi:MAG: hypothetical protein IJW00_04485 [Clostridia bacterium]|nr:hypothetical protein [Clostridia bacterium]
MEATKTNKPESGFKRTVKKAGAKTKAFVGKKTAQVKAYQKQLKSDKNSAFDVGFKRGWDEAYNIPKRYSARWAAAQGFKKGVVNRYRSDKYANYHKTKSN